MSGLQEVLSLSADSAWGMLAVFLRVAATMFSLPALGEQMISVRIRLVLTSMLTVAVAPAIFPNLPNIEPNSSFLFWILLTETLAGLFIGMSLRLFVFAIQTAGAIAAQSTSLAQLMGQAGVDPLPAIGHILSISALALLMATGFHVKAAAFLVLSYEWMPAFVIPNPTDVADAGRKHVAKTFALAFSLAAPFVILSVLYNLTLGVINKAMPQLMVAFVGAPVITLGSVVMLLFCAPVMLTTWLSAVEGFLVAPFR